MAEQNQNSALRQYVTFKLDEEFFALNVSQVREVLEVSVVTKVPRSADFMRGVINVRGSVVPVADLRLKFGMMPADMTVDTRILVIELVIDGATTILGVIADSVHDVMEISEDGIEPAPRIGTKFDTRFISGIGKCDDQFIIILDIDKVFSTEEAGLLEKDQAA